VRDVDARDLRRAEAVFQENLPRSFGIELADLSRDRWSVIPKFGDLVSEMNADRGHLTYMKSTGDPEDIRFFDRTRTRTIAIYPSKDTLASRTSSSTNNLRMFDIVHYDIAASLDPRREWIDGKATLMVGPAHPVSTLTFSLAEPLTVQSVTSRRLGYLMALRVSGQQDLIINLPEPLRPNELLDLEFTYSGRLPAVNPESEAMAVAQQSDFFGIQVQPSYIYTGRSRWYPQAEVTDYATANLVLRVPRVCSVCERRARRGVSEADPSDTRGLPWREYRFSATQPVRYLGWATSRFVHAWIPHPFLSLRPMKGPSPFGASPPPSGASGRIELDPAATSAGVVGGGTAGDEVLRNAAGRHPVSKLHTRDRRTEPARGP
jgi:hypothetical protein